MSSSNKDLPLVSIYIAAYNHERYVQETIQSIIDQDYPRIELIITDDGSKDGTWTKIQEMRPACEKRFERVVMRTRENKGCNVTCQENEQLAQGAIIGGIASDDRYLPGAISTLVQPMIDDESIGFTVGTNVIIDGDGRRCYWDGKWNNVYNTNEAVYRDFDSFVSSRAGLRFDSPAFGSYETLVRGNYIPNGSLHRRSITIPSAGTGVILEDWWFHLQFSKVAKYRHVKAETFAYRWHGANTMRKSDHVNRMAHATQERELNLLYSEIPESAFAEIFKKTLPLCETVWGVHLGNHFPRIERCRNWDSIQYRFVVSSLNIPITWKIRIHIKK